jgi:hypothetical protein
VVVDALNLELDVQLQGLAGHFELDLQFDTSGTFTVPLLPPGSPFGVKVRATPLYSHLCVCSFLRG